VEPELAAELANSKMVTHQMEEYSHKLQSDFSIIWTGNETLENLEMLAPAKNDFNLDVARVRAIADYQFGPGAADLLFNGKLEFVKSKNTGKIRNVISNGEHVLSLRASEGLFTLKKPGASRLHKGFKSPKLRVSVNQDSVEFNRQGKNVFSKFVISTDPDLRPGDEVLITDDKDELIAIGRMILTADEMHAFNTGIAIRIREGFE
jgi:7-cyano-7-deazaguanine tRNA-ribosyltransferase